MFRWINHVVFVWNFWIDYASCGCGSTSLFPHQQLVPPLQLVQFLILFTISTVLSLVNRETLRLWLCLTRVSTVRFLLITWSPALGSQRNCWQAHTTTGKRKTQCSGSLQGPFAWKEPVIPKPIVLLPEKWRANNITLSSPNTFCSPIKLSAPTPVNLWTCFETQDDLMLPAKWTVNIIPKVIPLLLCGFLTLFPSLPSRETLDLVWSRSRLGFTADSDGP